MNLERAIQLQREKNIIDVKTGEVIPMSEATDMQLSGFLTKVNEMRKAAIKVEKYLKDEVKNRLTVEWENDEQFVGNHRAKRYYSKRFDSKLYKKEAGEAEKKAYEEVKEKYSVLSETIIIS